MENHRLTEMEEILNAPSGWEGDRRNADSEISRARISRPDPPCAASIRVRQKKRRRNRNPFPPVIIIADDEDDEDGDVHRSSASSGTSMTQTHIERIRLTHKRRRPNHVARKEKRA